VGWRLVGEGLFDWPTPAGHDADGPSLHGAKCAHCGEVLFPYLEDCPVCMEPGVMEPFELAGRGRLRDFVITQRGPSGFVVPYVQGFVQLDDGPVIYSLLTGVEPTEDGPTVGARMEMVIETIRHLDDADLIGWKFRPEAAVGV
jgi:uncharacterized OB-fold protein